jgi:lysophospholipase L1-like esterase
MKKKAIFYLLMPVLVVFLMFVALEGVFQIGALFVGLRPTGLFSSNEQKQIILCLGDSHTYGIYYSEEEAYPGQIQRLLEERAPGRYHVLNLGLPGMNSSQIAARLPEWIDQYHPAYVIVCAGINNYWNRSDAEVDRGIFSRSLHKLRTYRLFNLLKQRITDESMLLEGTGRPELERVLIDDGRGGAEHRNKKTGEVLIIHKGNLKEKDKFRTTPEAVALLRRDLETVLSITRGHRARLILLTYSAAPINGEDRRFQRHNLLSNEMVRFGEENDVQVVDVRETFVRLLKDRTPRSRYFVSERDDHPNPSGYLEIAKQIVDVIEPQE